MSWLRRWIPAQRPWHGASCTPVSYTHLIAGYSVTRPGALAGVKYFLVPNTHNFSWMTVVTAMGQMFYSCLLYTSRCV